jgi:hypothetical protein
MGARQRPPCCVNANIVAAPTFDWQYHTEDAARLGHDVPVLRGRVIGGSSAMNAAVAMRARSADFRALGQVRDRYGKRQRDRRDCFYRRLLRPSKPPREPVSRSTLRFQGRETTSIRRPEKMTNKTLLAPTTVVDALKIRSLAVHANRIRQHYLEAGSGPTVVLLHGFPETNYVWRHQIPVLAGYYRVIAPDLRGYGETEDHPDAIAQQTVVIGQRPHTYHRARLRRAARVYWGQALWCDNARTQPSVAMSGRRLISLRDHDDGLAILDIVACSGHLNVITRIARKNSGHV